MQKRLEEMTVDELGHLWSVIGMVADEYIHENDGEEDLGYTRQLLEIEREYHRRGLMLNSTPIKPGTENLVTEYDNLKQRLFELDQERETIFSRLSLISPQIATRYPEDDDEGRPDRHQEDEIE